ncbi:MAG: hypothetical protein KJ070_26780 [Verrucomicrobia bacterium]|nr:hypothetical protein [Verrucomicrobiota bacterium]
MKSREEKVLCRTPTPGKQPTRIDAGKFALVRKAILAVLPRRSPGVRFRDLPARVARKIPAAQRLALGSIPWYVTSVKLELEVRGEIRRVSGVSPQVLVRT